MHIGRDFKREIELVKSKEFKENLRPNRRWLDLFSLSLSDDFFKYKFDFTILIDYLCEDEVIIIINSHDDIFKNDQIQYWSKETISDILPAIKCSSFKSKTKIFKTSELDEMRTFIYYQNHTKSFVIENAGDKISINLVYGETVKITPSTFDTFIHAKFFNILKERYTLWEISDCACKPKKIRAWVNDFENLKYAIDQLKWISNINDAKLGMYINSEEYYRSFCNYGTIVFNHWSRWMSDETSNLIFTGDTFAVVSKGNHYNFRLDERTKESEDSYIKGNIIKNNSINYFALDVDRIKKFCCIQADKEEIKSKDETFIEDLKEISTRKERFFIVFDKKDVTLKIDIDEIEIKMSDQEFYSKVDVKINDKITSKKLIKMVKLIPSHLEIRLETDNIEQIIELMKSKILIEKFQEQGIKFLYNGIEIEPRIIKSKMDGADLKNEVKEIKAKRDRLNMDCDR